MSTETNTFSKLARQTYKLHAFCLLYRMNACRFLILDILSPPAGPAHQVCIPLHVPVTNHHPDQAKNKVALLSAGNIIFRLSRVSPVPASPSSLPRPQTRSSVSQLGLSAAAATAANEDL